MKDKRKWIAIAAVLVVAAVALWAVLFAQRTDPDTVRLLLDGKEMTETTVNPGAGAGLRVIVKLSDSNTVVADLPFGEPHTLQVIQEGGYNTIRVTENAVYMEKADCRGQQCVNTAEITRDNLETRVLRDLIICSPHKLIVQVAEQN